MDSNDVCPVPVAPTDEDIDNETDTEDSAYLIEKSIDVDDATFSALQIFQRQFHPSVYKQGRSGFKEGLSLFGLCSRCRSSPGAAELRRWFRHPLSDQNEIRRRQAAVSFFVQDCHLELAGNIQKSLRHIKNMKGVIDRLEKTQATVGDWVALYKTAYFSVNVATMLKNREVKVDLLAEIAAQFPDDVGRVGILLNEMVDFDEMKQEGRFVVRRGIHPELDKKKRQYKDLPTLLSRIAQKEFDCLQYFVTECSIMYLPMLGYLVCVPRAAIRARQSEPSSNSSASTSRDGSSVEVQIPGLDFVFLSDNTVYYKNANMRALDEDLGDLKFQIVDLETSLMLELKKVVMEVAPALLKAVRLTAKLDCLIALAITAREHQWVRPELAEEPVLEVDNSRHPLLEVVNAHVVKNPINSGSSHSQVKILLGPNASGKSVYLKQVGVVAFLNCIGSFVPASRARIGPIDRIFTRIHTVDSVLDGMSTFARDLEQVAEALRGATSQSLVIIDEFGKGTAMEVGLSLLSASLEHWLEGEDGGRCPHLFVSSHFHALVGLLPDSPLLHYQTMQVHRDGGSLIFLYKLVDGIIDCSYAAYTALQAGLSDEIISRSYEVYNNLKTGDLTTRLGLDQEDFVKEYRCMETIVNKFVTFDPSKDKVKAFLQGMNQFACSNQQPARNDQQETQGEDKENHRREQGGTGNATRGTTGERNATTAMVPSSAKCPTVAKRLRDSAQVPNSA